MKRYWITFRHAGDQHKYTHTTQHCTSNENVRDNFIYVAETFGGFHEVKVERIRLAVGADV